MSDMWMVVSDDETCESRRQPRRSPYSHWHVLDHADPPPRSGPLPRALVAVSNVLTGRVPQLPLVDRISRLISVESLPSG